MTRPFYRWTVAVLAAVSSAKAQAPSSLSTLPPSAYEHVYRHVRHLQAVDTAAAAAGHTTNLSAYYKNLASLTQPQADALQALSLAALAELEPLDQQAQTLILQARAQVHKAPPGQKPPAPPPELTALQASRKAVLNKYHDNLVQALGQSAFSRLDQALMANFKVGATAPNQGTGH
jgi:hypothetical protein